VKTFTDDAATTLLLKRAVDQERIMSKPACHWNAEADLDKDCAGATARRVPIASDNRVIAIAFTIIGMLAVIPLALALLGQHFAPAVAMDLQHQSEVLDEAGDPAGAIAASRRAADIYRGLMTVGMVQYEPELAAGLHDLSIRLHEAGDDAGALAAIREAVEIRRGLAGHSASYVASLEQSLQMLTRIEATQHGELRPQTTENAAPKPVTTNALPRNQ
jgi:hypothetical protein